MITHRAGTQALAALMAIPLGNEVSGSVAVPAFAFSGLLLRGLRVASSGSQAWGDGRGCHASATAGVELGHFSTSGPGWVVECGEVPRNWCHVQSKTNKT